MDSTLQPAYNPQAPLPSFQQNLESTMTSQAQNTIEAASNATRQVFASPLQPSCSQASAPMQPLSKAISKGPSAPVAPAKSSHIMPLDVAPAPAAEAYPQQIEGLGGPTATAPFLQDFNLVAEAAKRAQMGIVMRDLESVTL